MSLVTTAPARIALMLRDSDSRIVDAYHYVLNSLDQIRRPCYYVNSGEESYLYEEIESAEEEIVVETTFRIEYIGLDFTSEDESYDHPHEIDAREISVNTLQYFRRRPHLQFSDTQGHVGTTYGNLQGVTWARLSNRSTIGIYQMEGVGAIDSKHWGFSYSMTMRSLMPFDEEEILISG